MLKKILLVAAFIACYLVIKNMGLLMGGLISIPICLGTTVLIHAIASREVLKLYRDKINHVFVVSRHPDTKSNAELPGLYKYIKDADYEKVLKTKKEIEDLLVKSGNKFYNDPGIKEKDRLKVIPVMYKDGEHEIETWPIFLIRARGFIEEEVSKRHKILKNASNDMFDYEVYGNNQST